LASKNATRSAGVSANVADVDATPTHSNQPVSIDRNVADKQRIGSRWQESMQGTLGGIEGRVFAL
jgi:hypothetical protein